MLCNDMRTVETFKDRLRKAAHYAGVECSQTAIGRSLGTNKQTVDRWFGGSVPRPAMIFHIANTWRVDARCIGSRSRRPATKERPAVLDVISC